MKLFPSGFRKGFFCVFRVGVDGARHVLLYDNSKIKHFLATKFWWGNTETIRTVIQDRLSGSTGSLKKNVILVIRPF